MRAVLACLVVAFPPAAAAADEPTGRIIVSVGVCAESVLSHPALFLRKFDRSDSKSIVGPLLPFWDYADETGEFKVAVEELSAGHWEIHNHAMTWNRGGGASTRYKARIDYSVRFLVEPGKLVDLGRYCAASQATGEAYGPTEKVWFPTVKRTYLHVSPNRPQDVEAARKPAGGGAPMEVVDARPNPPESVFPLLKGRFIEPRMIRKIIPEPPAPFEHPR